MNRKLKRKVKRLFSPYNIAIFVCIIVIAIVVLKMFVFKDSKTDKTENAGQSSSTSQISNNNQGTIRETDGTQVPTSNIKVVKTNTKEGETISEKDAKKLAIKQFKELDEKGLKEENLELIKVLRANEEYYYITSPKNTLEIKLVGGMITRINSIPVDNL